MPQLDVTTYALQEYYITLVLFFSILIVKNVIYSSILKLYKTIEKMMRSFLIMKKSKQYINNHLFIQNISALSIFLSKALNRNLYFVLPQFVFSAF